MEPMVVQEQLTSTTSTTAVQPLTSLWAISEGYLAMSHGERAAKHERDARTEDVVLLVTSAYLGALKSEKLVEVTRLSVEQIEAHVERAKAFHRAGVLGLEQVLEAKARLAEANSGLAQAEGGLLLARSNLAFHMGLPVDEDVVPEPISYDRLPQVDTDEERGFRAALAQRPELAAASARVRQATAGRRAAWASMLPQLSAIGSYQHTEGSSFMREDQFFVGLSASWTFWEWGATAYGIPEAKARERQAKLGKELLREGLRLEIRKARIAIDVAKKQVQAARVAIEQAEENLRIVERRFEANAVTTTDVLDAMALKSRARIGEVTAFYEYLEAVAKFRRATGEPIVFEGAITSRKG
jgi:outer membrane protein TolC